MQYEDLYGKDIEKAFKNDCSLDFERPAPIEKKEHDISVIDQQVLFSLMKNPEIITNALQDPDILINVTNTLRNMNDEAEMDASMMVDKKEETASDVADEETDTLTINANASGNNGSTTEQNNESISAADNSPATSEKTEGNADSKEDAVLKPVKSEDIYSVAELQEELNEILNEDMKDGKLTKEQIRWIRYCQKILRSSFMTLKAMELFCINYHKAIKKDLYYVKDKKNIRPMRKMDINVLRIIYEMTRPEDIIADLKYDIFYENLPVVKAPYHALNTFVRYCENL